ncbi:MAG: CvpA family protein [Phycisphaerales bacterium]|nr:CvpA family protein [Phycisphaerales bacterium]
MYIAYNLAVILLVLLIAYWWANQGFLSAMLHLLAVILAGAVALGFWEPLASVMIRGNSFDQYAYGVSLILLFAVALLIFRVASDKIAGANVSVPRAVDLIGGGLCGLGAGTLTVGILLIGCGFVYSHKELMGYRGYGRSERNGEVLNERLMAMWLPAEELTSKFYTYLSAGALYPDFSGTPLYQYNPQLHRQMYLVRDSFDNGVGALTMPKDAAKVTHLYYAPDCDTVGVMMKFGAKARDFGDQMTISASQVRLIGSTRGPGSAPVVHPKRWVQNVKDKSNPLPFDEFTFDSVTNYATGIPGQNDSSILFEFQVPAGFQPKLIQVRNVKYTLPAADEPPASGFVGAFVLSSIQELDPDEQVAIEALVGTLDAEAITEYFVNAKSSNDAPDTFGGSIDGAVIITNRSSPVRTSKNTMPSGMETVGQQFSGGNARFPRNSNQGRISKMLIVDSFYEPEGTRMVMVDVSRNSPANIFIDRLYQTVSDRDQVHLLDADGNQYFPVGFLYETPEFTEINLRSTQQLGKRSDIPKVPSRGDFRLRLMFYVTADTNLVELRWGDIKVGTMNNMYVEPNE